MSLFVLFFLIVTAILNGQIKRTIIGINDNWIFRGSNIAGDSVIKTVSVPHTWNDIDALNGFDYYRGKGKYTKSFIPDRNYLGKRVFLKFDGVQTIADVYWNGTHLGQHRGGYSAFLYEITGLMRFDSVNRIIVEADNSVHDDILPFTGDFNVYGGIYRPVSLIITDRGCISPLDNASPGVYLSQENITNNEAQIGASVILSNGYEFEKTLTTIINILDDKGTLITSSQKDELVKPGENITVKQGLTILQPHLWNGKKDPYLYKCVIQIKTDGRVIDEVTQQLGLRYFNIDAEKGFYLNGNKFPLHGVARHQDNADRAAAINPEDQKKDMDLIREIGANAIRLAHYQHDDYFYSLADTAGIIVWAEIPFTGDLSGGFKNSSNLTENARQQLRELIRQNYNHPSIFFWGIFNDLSSDKDNSPEDLVSSLKNLSESEDPTRITTAASFLPEKDKLNSITPVIAWNKYFGWYYGKPEMLGRWADKVHSDLPRLKIGISEYGAGGNPLQHSSKTGRPFPFLHFWHPEEYQAVFHEKSWNEIVGREYIWCSFVWNMFDFGSSARDEGDISGLNDKGLVSFDRKTKKDAFYFYKANWNQEPMVYITNRRFAHRTADKTTIKVYSNAENVELFVNGESLGETTGKNSVFIWKNVQLQNGSNSIKATAFTSKGKIEDSCVWAVNNNKAARFAVWFFRIGIKPFIVLCFFLMIFFYFKVLRHPKKGWRRKLLIVTTWIFTIILIAFLVALIYGKTQYINIFDYSVF